MKQAHRTKLKTPLTFTSKTFHHACGSFSCIPTRVSRRSASHIKTRNQWHVTRTRVPGRRSTRVRDEHIEASKMFYSALHCCLCSGGVAHVDDEREQVSVWCYAQHGGFRLRECRGITRNERKRGACAREGERNGLPDATRCAGNKGDFSSKNLRGICRCGVNCGVHALDVELNVADRLSVGNKLTRGVGQRRGWSHRGRLIC
jgi:hypothetical protein